MRVLCSTERLVVDVVVVAIVVIVIVIMLLPTIQEAGENTSPLLSFLHIPLR